MTHGFGKDYWEQHWQDRNGGPGSMAGHPPNPHLARELGGLVPGTALDAGCGAGAEARWLAGQGWQVTAADISASALAQAAAGAGADRVQWIEADLGVWSPVTAYDLVTTHYAHPAMPQLDFYDRLAGWVAPGGTLLIVGHLHTHGARDGAPGSRPPAEASATAAAVTALLDAAEWDVVTAEELHRTVGGRAVPLHDVVVRAARRS